MLRLATEFIVYRNLLYLLCKATVNINAGNLAQIPHVLVESPPGPSGNYKAGKIYKSEYLKVAVKILDFINTTERAPNYATSLGRVPYQRPMYAKIINFWKNNSRLPSPRDNLNSTHPPTTYFSRSPPILGVG
ncbi:MAG TPA: hypothetical protein GXX31_03805 [Methanothermobacter sp.]|jgi:hypothetical protein|nr:pseudomurein-binding repeat-containing protein [Methanothermobacter sp.]HHW16492.1 hypothetical protein [Methanothermobacter sp.]